MKAFQNISKFRFFGVFMFLLFLSVNTHATHIVGGELFYTQNEGNSFQVTLIVYRDCDPNSNTLGTGFDQAAAIGIYNNSNLVQTLELSLANAAVSNVPISLENPCFTLPPDLCIEQAIYNGSVTLAPATGGYDLVYQRCCRNSSIINLNFPEDTGMTMWAQIPGSDTNANGANNSARFVNTPPVAMCQGAEFFFDHSATDVDGDLLTYEFCSPFFGGTPDAPAPNPPPPPAFTPVDWATGFNENNQIAASPDMQIDPVTGQITGTPTQLGRFAVGICVKEYRNGELISTVMRDFQYQVTTCDPTIIAAIPDQTQFCDGLSFQFDNSSINANLFFWDFGDPFSTQDTSSLNSPLYTYSTEGEYEVTLIANPGWSCADTSSSVYAAFPQLEVSADPIDFECNNGVAEFTFNGDGNFELAISDITWSFPAALNSSGTDGITETITAPEPGVYGVTFTVEENGCTESVDLNLQVPASPEAEISPQSLFCEGYTFDFINESVNATEFDWDFGVIGSANDVSSDENPSFTYPSSGDYNVTLTASAPLTCPDVATAVFDIEELLEPFFSNPDPECFDNHSFDFQASGFSTTNPIFNWEFGNLASPEDSNLEQVNNVTWSEPGNYPVTLTITENDCTKSIQQGIELIANPVPDFHVFLNEGCPPLEVSFFNDTQGFGNLEYLWTFGDGNTSTSSNPIHSYLAAGFYDVTLQVNSTSGCVDEVDLTFPDLIQVFPFPVASFESDFYTVSFLEPTVNLTDLSTGGTSCFYDFDDGATSTECDPTHEFLDAGFFDVTQTVSNEFGCFDQITIPFKVDGHFFYAPNSFTPNNDNLNEVFLPVVIGVTKYQFRIYNRWGDVIFETTDPDQGWNGSINGGDHYAPNGVYSYQIVVNDLTGFPHEYSGHISVIR